MLKLEDEVTRNDLIEIGFKTGIFQTLEFKEGRTTIYISDVQKREIEIRDYQGAPQVFFEIPNVILTMFEKGMIKCGKSN